MAWEGCKKSGNNSWIMHKGYRTFELEDKTSGIITLIIKMPIIVIIELQIEKWLSFVAASAIRRKK